VTAAVAALEMTAESGGAAHLDRGHDAPLSRESDRPASDTALRLLVRK